MRYINLHLHYITLHYVNNTAVNANTAFGCAVSFPRPFPFVVIAVIAVLFPFTGILLMTNCTA